MSDLVKITVTGMSDAGDPEGIPDCTQTETTGTMAVMGDKHVISYEETDSETGSLLKTILKFDDREASVSRVGSIESKLVFVKDEKYETCYMTPYGSFTMGTFTDRYDMNESDKKIDLHISYDMEINGAFVSKNSIVIEIEII